MRRWYAAAATLVLMPLVPVLPGCGLDLEGNAGLDAGLSDASVPAEDARVGLDGTSDAGGGSDVGTPDSSAKDAAASDGGVIADAGPLDSAARDAGRDVGPVGDPGIRCASSFCNPATEVCCRSNGTYTCIPANGSCNGIAITCDDRVECAAGSICCARLDGMGRLTSVGCSTTPPGCNGNSTELCDPDASTCPQGTVCQPASSELPGYFDCN